MDKETVLKNYWSLGINSQANLFEYVMNNETAILDERRFNLRKSNECMEFMAGFLEALNFEVVRLYLEKTKDSSDENIDNYWFLAFSNGFKWFYYEPCLKEIEGQYVFNNYNSLTAFAVAKIISVSEKNINDSSVYEKYTLREIDSLPNLMLGQDIKLSKEGKEILLWNTLDADFDYEQVIKNAEMEEIENREDRINRTLKRQGKFFWVGFIPTLVIGLALLWYLAYFFYGN